MTKELIDQLNKLSEVRGKYQPGELYATLIEGLQESKVGGPKDKITEIGEDAYTYLKPEVVEKLAQRSIWYLIGIRRINWDKAMIIYQALHPQEKRRKGLSSLRKFLP
jgi:hypothetical protein